MIGKHNYDSLSNESKSYLFIKNIQSVVGKLLEINNNKIHFINQLTSDSTFSIKVCFSLVNI